MEAASLSDVGPTNDERFVGSSPEITTPNQHRRARRARRPPVRALPGAAEAAELRNSVPRERAPSFFSYLFTVVAAGLASVSFALPDLPDQVALAPAGFFVIAVLAVAVDSQSFTAPGRPPASTVFPSIAFTFALLLGWGLAPAVVVQAAAVGVSAIRLRHAPWRAAFDASQYRVGAGRRLADAPVGWRAAPVQRRRRGHRGRGRDPGCGVRLVQCQRPAGDDRRVAALRWALARDDEAPGTGSTPCPPSLCWPLGRWWWGPAR